MRAHNRIFAVLFLTLSLGSGGQGREFRAPLLATVIGIHVTTEVELIEPSDYTQQARLAATPPVGGFATGVSVSGNTAVVFSGAGVFVYIRSGEVWTQQAVLIPSDGVTVMSSVGIDGDTVVIGGSGASINGNSNQGAAYVFQRSGTTWSELARLIASDGTAGDQFGNSVAINGDTLIVGANKDDNGAILDQGSSYVFVRQGTVWTQQAKLTADDGSANHRFGNHVAISNNTVIVTRDLDTSNPIPSFNPAAYVFIRSGIIWSQQQRLSVCEPSGFDGHRCGFGSSIAIDGDDLAVANSSLNVGSNGSQGGVYVFTRSGTIWSQQQRLTASDGLADDGFGYSVALEINSIISGSWALNARPGAAYLFTRSDATWTQRQKFQEPSPNVSNVFGYSVSKSGNTFIVGVPRDQGMPGPNAIGAAYVYVRPGTPQVRTQFDFDGDVKSDISIFRPNGGNGAEWWWLRSSDGGNGAATFGAATDMIVPGDYTGDGKADIAVWRPSNGNWFVLRSEDSSFFAFPFGTSGDVPVPADFDGDGKTDAGVFRPSDVTWYISRSSGGTTIAAFGSAGDKAVPADYDGDGKADIAIFRPNGANGAEWWLQRSSNSTVFAAQFGAATDKAVVGDYTGDNKSDIAIWRPADGNWFILRSEDLSFFAFPFGTNGDLPTPGDYDGDGKTDAAVFRPSNSTWFAQRSTAGTLIQQFGQAGDLPVPNAFVR